MTVTVIQDLSGEMPASIFSGPASEEERLQYFTDGKTETGINAFLLQAGGKIALFDAGAGLSMQHPGKTAQTLAALGVKPEDVDFVLLTHMHMDHIGGLLREGKRAFPRAKVLVAKPELEAWLALAENAPADAHQSITRSAPLAKAVAEAYGADMETFAFGDAILPGVEALDAPGHTPGHTIFRLTAGGRNLLIIGDLVHAMSLQFALPDECAVFDMDQPGAILARKRVFELAEREGMEIAGVHFPFANAAGALKKDGNGWKFERTP